MEDRRTDPLNQPPVPAFCRQRVKEIVVFVIAGDKKRGEGLGVQPVQPVLFFLRAVPEPSEIAADDDVILFPHFLLFRKIGAGKATEIAVCVAGQINHIGFSLPVIPFLCAVSSIIPDGSPSVCFFSRKKSSDPFAGKSCDSKNGMALLCTIPFHQPGTEVLSKLGTEISFYGPGIIPPLHPAGEGSAG